MNSFSRTLRSLANDNPRRSILGLVVATLLLAAWSAWFFGARVSNYAVSESGRIIADRSSFPLETSVGGRVVSVELELGREVQAGEVLVSLETKTERLQLEEERIRLASLRPQLEKLRQEISSKEQALGGTRGASRAAIEEARAQLAEAEALAGYAEDQAERAGQMLEQGIVSEVEHERLVAEARNLRAAADRRQAALNRLIEEQGTRHSDRQADLQELERAALQLEGEIRASQSKVQQLEHEIERRLVRSPVSGTLGDVVDLQVGTVVHGQQQIGTVVRPGSLKVVADFSPAEALGRVRSGQRAKMRLDGFPWTQYGTLSLTVLSAASEVRDGRARVELSLGGDPNPHIPLQHGLTGSIEIEVERISPATLVLRAAGQMVSSSASGSRKSKV